MRLKSELWEIFYIAYRNNTEASSRKIPSFSNYPYNLVNIVALNTMTPKYCEDFV